MEIGTELCELKRQICPKTSCLGTIKDNKQIDTNHLIIMLGYDMKYTKFRLTVASLHAQRRLQCVQRIVRVHRVHQIVEGQIADAARCLRQRIPAHLDLGDFVDQRRHDALHMRQYALLVGQNVQVAQQDLYADTQTQHKPKLQSPI